MHSDLALPIRYWLIYGRWRSLYGGSIRHQPPPTYQSVTRSMDVSRCLIVFIKDNVTTHEPHKLLQTAVNVLGVIVIAPDDSVCSQQLLVAVSSAALNCWHIKPSRIHDQNKARIRPPTPAAASLAENTVAYQGHFLSRFESVQLATWQLSFHQGSA